jgi:hypothetical protein
MCTREINARISMAKATLKKEEIFNQQIGLQFKGKISEVLHWGHIIF